MTIYDMIPGKLYYCNDGYGIDKVECIGQVWDRDYGCNCVRVKYVESGEIDIWFEVKEYIGNIEVKPYS